MTLALVAPAATMAAPPRAATNAALHALKPSAAGARVVVFAAPKPLARGAVVTPLASTAPADGVHRVPTLKLKRRAWLFWQDDAYDAEFEHASTVLLVDARTHRPAGRLDLGMPPLVDGRALPFDATATGYRDRRLIVYAHFSAPVHGRAAPAPAPRVAAPRNASFPGDCLITIGDRGAIGQQNNALKGKPILQGSFDAIEHWADTVQLPTTRATTTPGLADRVDSAIAGGCVDVFVFIAGHGLPPPGVKDASGHTLPSGPAGVLLDSVTAGAAARRENWLTPDDLAAIVDAHPTIEFKFKIESCFSGRFADEPLKDGTVLPQHQNVRVIETSSSSTESSYAQMFDPTIDRRTRRVTKWTKVIADNPFDAGEFTNGDVHGLDAWAASPQEQHDNPGLAGAIARSSDLGAAFDGAQKRDYTHPVVMVNEPLPLEVTMPNQPPVAAFTFAPDDPPSGPKANQTVTFDGAASSDPDGHVASWAWSFGGSGVQSTHEFPNPGIYPVTVTVTDDRGATAQVTHDVKVSGPGTKSDNIPGAGDPPLVCGPGVTTGESDIRVPSYAQNVRIKSATSSCPGFTVGTTVLGTGNDAGVTDEWGAQKNTFQVRWSIDGSGTGDGTVTIEVEWD